MPRPSSRARLLDLASTLVVDEGVTALTYERLAMASGVSKGGLLYHFPTKTDLLTALLDDTLDRFERVVERQASVDGSWARAYVEATFDVEVSRPDVALAVLLASSDVSPELLRQCARRFDDWEARLRATGLPPGLAATVRHACDGWWTLRAIGGGSSGTDGAVLREHLLGLLADVEAREPEVGR